MSRCDSFEKDMEDFLAGEVVRLDGTPLGEHVRQCASCARVVALHEEWMGASAQVDMPNDIEFHRMRTRVRRRLFSAASSPRSLLGRFQARHWQWAAVLILGLGIGAVAGALLGPGSSVGDEESVVRDLGRVDGEPLAGDPVLLSNVTIRPSDPGRVEVGFDVVRHIERVDDLDSPLVKRLLVQALRTSSTLGSRLKAVDYAERVADPSVVDALIAALHNDESVAVRMKVIAVLSRMSGNPRVREAMLRTLEQDESVQMRLLAIDFLSEEKVDPDVLRRAIEASPSFSDPALMLRLSRFEE